jgi:hypothetical protein
MPSSTSNSEFQRAIPALPWRGMLLAAVALTAVATIAWELRARAAGYAPTLNDTSDVWADRREAVQPDSIVIIGDSRALFDTDLGEIERGLGRRPIQLALVGSCAYPVLENLANDEKFHGTVIASIVPLMWLAPPPSPPYQNSLKAIKRFQTRTVAHRVSNQLAMFLEEHIAFLKQEDLTSARLLEQLRVPDRAVYHGPPQLPPYFSTMDRERSTKMFAGAERPGPLQDRVKHGWLPLFTPPPPPSFVPPEAFGKAMGEAIEARFRDTAAAVKKIQARGGKVVFVRYPHSGALKEHEDKLTPQAGPWTRILAETGAPGIYYSDHPELIFDCPEWSHLSAADSVEFTKRLVPYLKAALGK